MKLSVIIPTYNRAESLRKTLQSLADAAAAPDLEVEIIVADNNSNDHTRRVVEEMTEHFSSARVEYLFEPRQGRSFALNAAILRAGGDILSAVDDDERIAPEWLVEVEKIFRERWDEVDFVGGKILPDLEIEPPAWVEPLKEGALCWRDYGDQEWIYDENSPMITGAHGVFKKSVFDKIGLYNENLGVVGRGFTSCEDDVLYDQLISNGLRGIYNPKLVMYHYVPAYRLDKNYYRQWLFGAGLSQHLMDAHYKPFDGAKLFGVPRWMYRGALAAAVEKIKNIARRDETGALAAESQPLVFAGFFYARNLRGSWADKPLRRAAGKIFKTIAR